MPLTPAARSPAVPAAPSSLRRAAVLGAAGALGLLAGFGAREGTPLVLLGTAGLRLRGIPEFITPDRGADATTLLGAVHAGLVAYVWALLAAAVARRQVGWRAVGSLAAVAGAATLLDPLLPAIVRLGAGAPSTGQRALCALVLVAAAGLGTRLAPRPRRPSAAAPTPPTPPAVVQPRPALVIERAREIVIDDAIDDPTPAVASREPASREPSVHDGERRDRAAPVRDVTADRRPDAASSDPIDDPRAARSERPAG